MPGPTLFRLVGAGGVPAYHELREGEDLPEGAVAVDRMPGPFEDHVDGDWVMDDRGLANSQVSAAVIEQARALKYLEALAIVSGVELTTGLLVLEAAERDMTPLELADAVLAHRVEFIRREVQRQRGQSGDHSAYEIPPGDPLAGL